MLQDITVFNNITIKQAMKIISVTGEKCLLVVDDAMKLLGTLSDGDLRQSILKGADFNTEIYNSYNRSPKVLIAGKFSKAQAGDILVNERIDLLPILDIERTVVDYITLNQIFGDKARRFKKLDVPVVIMAGGRGTRMEPFTTVLPKPLLPIHDKPIIEHIIDGFTLLSCDDFYITVNYKSKIMKAYFEELNHSYSVNFISEIEPLGTAGSLTFLRNMFNKPFFVTNCDVIVNIDYSDLYDFHKVGKYDITLVASIKDYVIPYGACELNAKGDLSHINEKPKYELLVNTGLYVINPNILNIIPENKFYHITHLIGDAKDCGKKIGVYPVDDNAWIDVGQWTEYKATLEKMEL